MTLFYYLFFAAILAPMVWGLWIKPWLEKRDED